MQEHVITTGTLQPCVHHMLLNLYHQALHSAGEHITCKSTMILTGPLQHCVHGTPKNLRHQALHSAGEHITCKSVVITTGTFLRGIVHVGSKTKAAGRIPSSDFEVLEVTCSHFLVCLNCAVTVFYPCMALIYACCTALSCMQCFAVCFALPWITLYRCVCCFAVGCTDVLL